jgi:hypothetical protein
VHARRGGGECGGWVIWGRCDALRTKLIQEASAPTVEEVLDRAGARAGARVPIKTATEILREDRDRR